MKWAVQLLQSEFDNVPLALDTSNKAAIEAGISVYNRSKGKPIVNSDKMQLEESRTSTWQQQMMPLLSLCVTVKESLQIMTNVWVI